MAQICAALAVTLHMLEYSPPAEGLCGLAAPSYVACVAYYAAKATHSIEDVLPVVENVLEGIATMLTARALFGNLSRARVWRRLARDLEECELMKRPQDPLVIATTQGSGPSLSTAGSAGHHSPAAVQHLLSQATSKLHKDSVSNRVRLKARIRLTVYNRPKPSKDPLPARS